MRRFKYWIGKLKLRRMKRQKYNSLIEHYLKMQIEAKVELDSMPHTNGGYVSNLYRVRKVELNKIIATTSKMIRIAEKQKRE